MSSISSLNSLLSSTTSNANTVDLTNILQAATGSTSSGIDVTAAVNAAVTAAQAPERAWGAQQTTLQSQTTALTQLQTDATNLDNDVQSLNSLVGPLSATTVTSSNSSVVTGSAAPGSAIGSNIIVVNNLASTASYSSTAVATSSTAVPTETFTLTDGSGKSASITTGSGVNTLSDLKDAINSAGLGITASIINDASGARIALVSTTSGSAGNFTATSTSSTFAFATAVTGLNASLTVNGIGISSATNKVTGVIAGVTLNLVGASPGTEITLAVAPDTAQASAAINQFVTDYNQAIGDLNAQFTFSGTGQGVLASDPTVRNLQSALLQALGYTASPAEGATSTTVQNLTNLGVSVNSNGTLSVNSTTLSSALQNNFSDVQNFFQGPALNGFANSLDQQLTSFISPADGAFTLDLQSLTSQNTTLQDNIDNFETNFITPLRTQLQAEYSAAEISLEQLPNEIRSVNTELGLNNSTTG